MVKREKGSEQDLSFDFADKAIIDWENVHQLNVNDVEKERSED